MPSSPAPQPIPAAPTRTVSQNNLQFISVAVATLLQTPESPAAKIAFPSSVSPKLASVPLYGWNCSYLI
ncbi:MAG: hypothetical protein ABI042_18690 [Verrucomicrobiota bacterium]